MLSRVVAAATSTPTAPPADAATADAATVAPAKGGTRSGHPDDPADDASAAVVAAPQTNPTDGSTVLPSAMPVVPAPVAPQQQVASPASTAPGGSARDGRIGAVGKAPGARAMAPRETDPEGAPANGSAASPADLSSAAVPTAPVTTAAPGPAPGPQDASAAAIAAAAPVQQAAPVASVAAPQAVAPTLVATTDPTVAQQLQGPLLSLRSAPDGDHVMVVRVSPEHLGMVTVHVTVSHGDLSVQLVASTTGGHDALQSMMTDLRRDLGAGGAGTATSLSLSSGDTTQQDQRGQPTWFGTGAGGSPTGGGSGARDDRFMASPSARAADDAPNDRRPPTSSSALLDVLA
jgi:flagellar hook-length control protein FliK